jgi:hypothetical protein
MRPDNRAARAPSDHGPTCGRRSGASRLTLPAPGGSSPADAAHDQEECRRFRVSTNSASGGGAPAPGRQDPSRPPPTRASRADHRRGRQRFVAAVTARTTWRSRRRPAPRRAGRRQTGRGSPCPKVSEPTAAGDSAPDQICLSLRSLRRRNQGSPDVLRGGSP